jgi:hypothetical protein
MRAVYAGGVDPSTRFGPKSVADRHKTGANEQFSRAAGSSPNSRILFSTGNETVRSDSKECSAGSNGWEEKNKWRFDLCPRQAGGPVRLFSYS